MERILAEIKTEVKLASELHKSSFSSLHEGYAVLLEEVDELWDKIKVNTHGDVFKKAKKIVGVRREAKQVAAMAAKIMQYCDKWNIHG